MTRTPHASGPDADRPVEERPDGLDETGDDGHEGATEQEVGDRGGPGPGYDKEPERTPDRGGVA